MNDKERFAMEALRRMLKERNELLSSLPEGTCLDCFGEGEVGGQFSGGYQQCPSCDGKGKKQ